MTETSEKASSQNRRRTPLKIAYGALILGGGVLAAAWFVPLVPIEGNELTVSFSEGGGVIVSADGSQTALVDGASVAAGGRVIAPGTGTVSLESVDGHTVTLSDSAELVATGSRRSILGDRVHTEVGLTRGEARVSGEGRPRSSLDVGLPNGVAGIRGTDLSLQVAGPQENAVSIHEGAVGVSAESGDELELSGGQGAVLTADGLEVSALPVAPLIRKLPADQLPVREEGTDISWSAVFGADRYLLSLASDSTFRQVRYRSTTESTSIPIPISEFDGPFFVRVQAVTADGLVGLPSELYAIRFAPHWAEALRLQASGSLVASLEEFDRALEQDPDSPLLHRDIGWSYYLLGRHGDALAPYQTALELAPGDTEIRVETARVHFWVGNYDEAEALYASVLELNPRHADALWGLGDVYRMIGRRGDAIELLERALEVDPDHPYARETLGLVRGGG